jgi:methyl-accepting chemotaxis protein
MSLKQSKESLSLIYSNYGKVRKWENEEKSIKETDILKEEHEEIIRQTSYTGDAHIGQDIKAQLNILLNTYDQLRSSLDELTDSFKEISINYNNGGDDMSDHIINLNNKINDINLKMAELSPEVKDIKNRIERIEKKVDELPTKSDMSNIVNEIVLKLDLPRKDYIGKEINGLHLKILLWMIGVVGVASTIIVRLLM